MFNRMQAERLRLLFIAGVAAPAAMVLLGFALAYVLRREVLDLAHWPSLRSLAIAAVTAGISMGLVYLLSKSHPIFEKALKDTGVKAAEEALKTAGYPVMFVVVSAAGLAEEVLFRGGLQPSIGLVLAALLFGFSHGGWRREMWAYVVAASMSGALFGFVYQWTGDLWVPIIAHTVHNIISAFVLGRGTDEENLSPDEEVLPITTNEPETEVEALQDESVAEPLPVEADSPEAGPEDGAPPDGEPERPV